MSEKVQELRAKLDSARQRVHEINADHAGEYLDPESDDGQEWNRCNEEIDDLEKTISQCEAREARVADLSGEPTAREAGFQVRKPRVRGDEIYDLSTLRAASTSPEDEVRQLKDRAKEAVERGKYPTTSKRAEDVQANVQQLLDTVDTEEGVLARRLLETGSDLYFRAFGKAVEGKPLTDSEARALSTTDAKGGYAIPFTLDPTVIHTSNYSVNPYRAISRVIPIVTDNWNGITSAGISVAYAGEAEEASDNSPEFAQPSAHPERVQAFIPFSVEIGQDWGGLQNEITSMIQEGKDDKEAEKFTSGAGSGSKEPEGILVGATTSVTTAGTATFAVGDVYKLEEELPARYRPKGQWVAKRKFYNAVRQFDTSGGAQLFTDNLRVGLGNNVPTPGNLRQPLLEYPANECSAMPYATTTGGTIAVFGDWSRFVIVDRIGMSVELIPHLFGENRRPTGQRGFYAIWRNTSKVVDANAFRKLKAL